MKVAIIGNGNMGKRYSSILTFYKIEHQCFDVDDWDQAKRFDRYMITSPTDKHCEAIEFYKKTRKPILCEKPISKDLSEVKNAFKYKKLTMLNQYRHLSFDMVGPTTYSYFKSGSDGLAWDCVNIIGLASKKPKLSNKSPIWKCRINGINVNFRYMDKAYMDEVKAWLAEPEGNGKYAIEAHKRVIEGWYEID